MPDVSGVEAADASGFLLRTVRALGFPVAILLIGFSAREGFSGEKAMIKEIWKEAETRKRGIIR